MGVLAAQDVGKDLIRRGDAHPPVDQEQADIGHVHRPLGQAAHPALQAVVRDLLQTRRVDHGKAHVEQPGVALAQVAGHAGLVIDQRQLAPDKAVEQGGLAHIGAAHDGEGETHLSLRSTGR